MMQKPSLPIVNQEVLILMCTYNGAKFLREQLDSLEIQDHHKWRLIVSDDGSVDETLFILMQYKKRWGSNKLEIRHGPRRGFCQNFLSLACDPNITGDFFAFCDQDDVWLKDKLSFSLECLLGSSDLNCPLLYCGRTIYVDIHLRYCGSSPKFIFPATFRNALVQSIAGGNTMVFNHASKHLLEKFGPKNVPSHDWWIYLLVTGTGGKVYYDINSKILYRQHQHSLVGGNQTIKANIYRAWGLICGRFRQWNHANVQALIQYEQLLSDENRIILRLFTMLRQSSIVGRFRLMEVCGLYRQTRLGTIGLFIAALLNRI